MSSDESEEEEVAYLAKTREKRSNAGSKMAKLLNDEEEDEFYQTTYGGFNEEGEDIDYDSGKSDSDDVIDSDFDIDEKDEVKSDGEDDEPKKKKKGGVGVYKEPKEKKEDVKTEKKAPVKKVKVKAERSTVQIYQTDGVIERKSRRAATAVKSEATAKREKQREEKSKMMKEMAARKNVPEVRRLTQEELLEGAKKTEKENLKSLENYYKLELEKKKSKIQKQVFKGPIIRYHSVTMPNLEEISTEPDIIVDGEGSNEATRKLEEMDTDEKCSRTFITFTDLNVFQDCFNKTKFKPPPKHICPVTKLPAKYFDPITQTPYANLQAFKCIREAYSQQCEAGHKRSKSQTQTESQVSNGVVAVNS